jgi:hypothetical protein
MAMTRHQYLEREEIRRCQDNQTTVREIGPGVVRYGDKEDGTRFGKNVTIPLNVGWRRMANDGRLIELPPVINRRPQMETGKTMDSLTKDERKAHPMARGLLDYFPDALAAVANVSHVGNEQHNPGEELHWARGKSTDQADCLVRHLVARGTLDDDGLRHTAKVAWRALAMLQLEIEDTHTAATDPPPAPQVKAEGDTDYPRPTYYVAGPMRGRKHFNFPAFDTAAAAGSMLGYRIISPADLDRAAGLFSGYLPRDDETLTPSQMKGCVNRDVKAILGLDPRTDGLLVLPDWELSSGARAEVALARWLGLEVMCADDFETILYPRKSNG